LMGHFPGNPPSLKNCRSLKINGDISFGNEVVFSGNVALSAKQPVKLEFIEIGNG